MEPAGGKPASRNEPAARRTVVRHTLPIRLMHWINFLCMFLLLLSGLQIFNAHPALYWGEASHFETPLVSLEVRRTSDGLRGVTTILGRELDTTGFLGASGGGRGELEARGFPAWLTVPGDRWLAMGRRWHFFFAWLFLLNGVAYVAYSIASRHVVRDLLPSRRDWRGMARSIVDHVLLRKPRGEAATRYNVLQKLSYLSVVFLAGPLVVLTGLSMSPYMNTVLDWLLDLFGGRQSARTVHFLLALALVAFFAVHVFEVVVTGLVNNMRSMVTGRYRVPPDDSQGDSS